jgi:5'-deoxynucleotidase YfbR-like HD superfamily hydrolase
VIIAALYHDSAEKITGDNPYPAKADNPSLKMALMAIETKVGVEYGFEMPLSEFEKAVLKIADHLELMSYCLVQLKKGNRYALGPYFRVLTGVIERILLLQSDCSVPRIGESVPSDIGNRFQAILESLQEGLTHV